jgi:hypothetical protein
VYIDTNHNDVGVMLILCNGLLARISSGVYVIIVNAHSYLGSECQEALISSG